MDVCVCACMHTIYDALSDTPELLDDLDDSRNRAVSCSSTFAMPGIYVYILVIFHYTVKHGVKIAGKLAEDLVVSLCRGKGNSSY